MELLDWLCGILESNLAHLQQRLLFGLNTLEQRRIGELEFVVLGSLKSIVRFGLRNLLDESLKITLIALDFEAVKVEDVGDGVVEEARVVRYDDCAEMLAK